MPAAALHQDAVLAPQCTLLDAACALLAGYYNVAPPGQAPVQVATGNDYAPTPAGASIILRTDLGLRLTTSASFAGQSQTNFATAMRALLAPYNFMSVAVSGFSVRPAGRPVLQWALQQQPCRMDRGQQVCLVCWLHCLSGPPTQLLRA